MTKSSRVTVEPCAQHLIAWMLADARQLYLSYENERGSHGWPQNDLREKARLLDNQVVFIVGYGAIGRRLAELLAPYPVRVIGCRRTPRGGFSSDLATLPLACPNHLPRIFIFPESEKDLLTGTVIPGPLRKFNLVDRTATLHFGRS
jgi:lactate dehydrogenase-like 2-hydroxyacid dehydrogenase